jgi:YVTN family beta-propeller protein
MDSAGFGQHLSIAHQRRVRRAEARERLSLEEQGARGLLDAHPWRHDDADPEILMTLSQPPTRRPGRPRAPLLALLLAGLLVAVLVLRAETATPRIWTVRVGRTPVAVAVAARSGRVFVANSADQTVSMLDARTGAALATIPLAHSPVAVALDETRGRVFTLNACAIALSNPAYLCRDGASSVSVLDLHSGTLLGTVSLGSGATTMAVDDRTGRVVVANDGADTLSLLDATTGRVLHTVGLGGAPMAAAMDAPLQHTFVSILNPFGGPSGVSMLDSRTGTLLNTVRVGRFVGAVLSDAPAERVLVSSDGDVYLLDARTGQTLRRIKDGGRPLAVDGRDGRALIGGPGQWRLIATHDGRVVGPVNDQGALRALSIDAVAVDEAEGRFYVAAHGVVNHGTPTPIGRVFVLNGRTGRVLRLLSLKGTPVALVVDAAAHRAFIVNGSTVDAPAGPEGGQPLVVGWLRRAMPWLPLPAAPPASGLVTVLDTARL